MNRQLFGEHNRRLKNNTPKRLLSVSLGITDKQTSANLISAVYDSTSVPRFVSNGIAEKYHSHTALSRITDAETSDDIHFSPMNWAEARKEGKEIEKQLGIS